MPAIALAIWGALLPLLTSIVGRVLFALGIGFVSYQGFDILFDWMGNYLQTSFAGFPAEVLGFLGFVWIDKAISMIMSATTIALTFQMTAGAVKKMVMK